jgi:hypothetical protein
MRPSDNDSAGKRIPGPPNKESRNAGVSVCVSLLLVPPGREVWKAVEEGRADARFHRKRSRGPKSQ